MNQETQKRSLRRRPFRYRSSSCSCSMEMFNCLNEKKHLELSTTYPKFVNRQNSISMTVSGTSQEQSDRHRHSTKRHLEDSKTIRNQCSLRTDDSHLLTLKSSRRKDGLSLDLASIALGRTIQVEAVPAPISSERTRKLVSEAKLTQASLVDDNCISSTSLATEYKKMICSYRSGTSRKVVVTRSYFSDTVSTKHGVVSSAAAKRVPNSVYGDPEQDNYNSENPITSISLTSITKPENVQIKENIPKTVINDAATATTLYGMSISNLPNEPFEIRKQTLSSRQTVPAFQIFPDRLKKHSTSLERSTGAMTCALSPQTSGMPKAAPAFERHSKVPESILSSQIMPASQASIPAFQSMNNTRLTIPAFKLYRKSGSNSELLLMHNSQESASEKQIMHNSHISASAFKPYHKPSRSDSEVHFMQKSQESNLEFQSMHNIHIPASEFDSYHKPSGSTSEVLIIQNLPDLASVLNGVQNLSISKDASESNTGEVGSTSVLHSINKSLESQATFQSRRTPPESTFQNVFRPLESTFQYVSNPLESTVQCVSKPLESKVQDVNKSLESTCVNQSLESTVHNVNNPLESTVQCVNKSLESPVQCVDTPLESTVQFVNTPLESTVHCVSEPLESTVHCVNEPLESTVQFVDTPLESTVQCVDTPLESTVHCVSDALESTVHCVNALLESTVHCVSEPLESTVYCANEPLESTVHCVNEPLESTVHCVNEPLESTVHCVNATLESIVQYVNEPLESTVSVNKPLESTAQHVNKPLESTVQCMNKPLASTVQCVKAPFGAAVQHVNTPLDSTVQCIKKPGELTFQRVKMLSETTIQCANTVQESTVHCVDKPQESSFSCVDKPLDSTFQCVGNPLESTFQCVDKPLYKTFQGVDKPLDTTFQCADKPLEYIAQCVDRPLASIVQCVDKQIDSTFENMHSPQGRAFQCVDKMLDSTLQCGNISLESTSQCTDEPHQSTFESMQNQQESTFKSIHKSHESTIQNMHNPRESAAVSHSNVSATDDSNFRGAGLLKPQSTSQENEKAEVYIHKSRRELSTTEGNVHLPQERICRRTLCKTKAVLDDRSTLGSSFNDTSIKECGTDVVLKNEGENKETYSTEASYGGLVIELTKFEQTDDKCSEKQRNIDNTTARETARAPSRAAVLNSSHIKYNDKSSDCSVFVSIDGSQISSLFPSNDSDSDENDDAPPLPLSAPPQLPPRSTTDPQYGENAFSLPSSFSDAVDSIQHATSESDIHKPFLQTESTEIPLEISTSLQLSEPGENSIYIESTQRDRINSCEHVSNAKDNCKSFLLIESSEVPSDTPVSSQLFELGENLVYTESSRRDRINSSEHISNAKELSESFQVIESSKFPSGAPVSLQLSESSRRTSLKDIIHENSASTESPSLTTLEVSANSTDITPLDCLRDVASTPAINSCQTEPAEFPANPNVSERTNDLHQGLPDAEVCRETPSGKTGKSSNPGEYGFVYSAERPVPPPEAGWSDKTSDEQKISLYSENVLKDGDTTESVDRESIADLSTTKKQWENIFTSHHVNQEDLYVKKKSAPKWEVRIPYKEKHITSFSEHDSQSSQINGSEEEQGDNPDMFKKQVDSESAIEREIRLAHEREEVIKKEKEIREKHTHKQKNQGQTIITSYEAESESFHPVYNELAEADRGSDLWGRGHRNRKHNEEAEDADQNNENVKPNESIIEREIRLQKEKEEEIARTRKSSSSTQQSQKQEQQSSAQHEQHIQHEVKDVNHNQTKVVSYEEAIAKNAHEGESRIARELRELKEREEELKKLRGSGHSTSNTDEVDGSVDSSQKTKSQTASSQRSSQAEPVFGHGLWQRDVASFTFQKRRESEDSASSHGSGHTAPAPDSIPSRHDVRVRPIADGNSDDEDKKPNYFEKQETPIEREMRLVRERENELRRQKGLPELEHKDENSYVSYGASNESQNSASTFKPRQVVGQPSESMRKFANSRLQQEVQKQSEREHELRSQGKIISTSEEHIEPKKYMEIAGLDKVDGTEKRNFVSKKVSVSQSESDIVSLGGQQEATASGGQVIRKSSTIASGGNMFSYKEFKQTAESKIERELREMREREEELRQQRTGGQAEDIP